MSEHLQNRMLLTVPTALLVGWSFANAEIIEPPSALEFLPAVLAMTDDPPPEYKLETLCQVHSVSGSDDRGYLSVLSIDGHTAFVIAFSPHKLQRPWETMTFRGKFVPTGQTSPIDQGTADWAYVFDRNGDGRIDFLAYRVGPLWILPDGMDERDLPSVKKGVMIDFLEANRDKLGQGFWFLADENFDGFADGLIARIVDKKSGWADGWLVTTDTDFDRRYETCTWMENNIDNTAKKCRKTKGGYEVRGHTVAGLNVVPAPGGFPLESFNAALAGCEFGADRLFADPLPRWSDYVPAKTDFATQPEAVTQKACYESRRYDSCHYLALRNDAKAQVTLGTMFMQARGVERDDTEAVTWLRKAANLGNAQGQFQLGLAHAVGTGVMQDDARAASWYRLAAEQDHAAAQYMLGQLLQTGTGVAKDEEEAVAWYRKSAAQDFADAQFMLGACSAQGLGVPQDDTTAAEWYRKAAEQGSYRAQFNLAFCYWNGKGVPVDYAESANLFRKAADQGYGPAEFQLALRYLYGKGVAEDKAEGIRWLRRAAHRGVADAQLALGGRYMTGDGLPENYIYAYAWLRIAELNGNEKAGEGRQLVATVLNRKQLEAAEGLVQEMLGTIAN